MGRHCCVSGCSTAISLPFHTFPKDITMAKKWKKAVYSDKIQNLSDEQLRKCIVCYKHFADTDYEATYRLRRLKPGVVPSLYLPNNADQEPTITSESETQAPLTSSTAIENIQTMENQQYYMEETSRVINPLNGDMIEPGSSLTKELTQHLDKHTEYFHYFTPKMWKLYRIACILKKKQNTVARKKLSFNQRIRQAKQYSKSPVIEKLLSLLTPAQRMFVQMQIKTLVHAPKDKHFTLDEKIAALPIMKESRECYQFVTQIFDLPSASTLQQVLRNINIHPGPINFINKYLKDQVKLMKQKNRVCFLTWDEMLLQPHLDYDATKKHIIGFESFGDKRTARFADHALVFMIRGVQGGWKFPLAYYFCDGLTKVDQLVEWIKIIAKIIIDSRLHLVAFVCNNKKRNRAAITKLKLESRLKLKRGEQYDGNIVIDNRAIIPLYDPPNLLRGLRNNLLNNDLEFDYVIEREKRKFASWMIIAQAYHMDLTHSVYRLMPKITMEHIIKHKVRKKKVKDATQVLSMTMGGFIHHHTNLNGHVNTINGPLEMPQSAGRDTAETIFFFDQLFDSVNGHTLKPEKPLRVAVSENSPHLAFWWRAIKRLREMRFVDWSSDRRPLKESNSILGNWISTVRGFRKLWKVLKTYEFKCFKPRILNQDSLAHFFRQIRSFGHSNPTCTEFESSFKTLLLNNMTSRCTVDDGENKADGPWLFTLKDFVRCRTKRDRSVITESVQDLEAEINGSWDRASICNSIATRLLNNSRINRCGVCKSHLTNVTKSELTASWRLLQMYNHANDILSEKMSNVCFRHHAALMLETELYTLMNLCWLNCQQHNLTLKELFISYAVVFYISGWCNRINKILMGEEHEIAL